MMMTRRHFLASTAVGALCPVVAGRARAQGPETALPDGVIPPYQWGEAPIPVSGPDWPGMAVVEESIERAMRASGVVGCGVCLVREDAIVYSRGFGLSELPDTPFLDSTASRCGSLAKPVAALCALTLLDMGRLGLDEAVLPILADIGILPAPVDGATVDERTARIVVRHLMDHTSGLPGYATYTAWREGCNVAERHGLDHVATGADVARDCLGNVPLSAEPGERYEYANANFVLLARVIEARSGMPFDDFLTRVVMPRFGLEAGEIYVSRNQIVSNDPSRGRNEAAYYQTRPDRFVSFVPSEQAHGRVYGEAYRGYATESSDGAGGIACTARGLGQLIANLRSTAPAVSEDAMREILTPPAHYGFASASDAGESTFYSKGFDVRHAGGRPWFAHGGMTIHCGGVIGHNAGYQFVVVSNWNSAEGAWVDSIVGSAVGDAVAQLG